jgi:hypothetical protein
MDVDSIATAEARLRSVTAAVDPPLSTPAPETCRSTRSAPCRPSPCTTCPCGGRTDLACCRPSVVPHGRGYRRWVPLMGMLMVLALLCLGAAVHPLFLYAALGLWCGIAAIATLPVSSC